MFIWLQVLSIVYIASTGASLGTQPAIAKLDWTPVILQNDDYYERNQVRRLQQSVATSNAPVIIHGTDVDASMIFDQFEFTAFEARIGDDTSVPVDNVLQPPYYTVGKITTTCPCQGGTCTKVNNCTGTLIGDRDILTAAHCVYNVPLCRYDMERCQQSCTDFKFYPAYPEVEEAREVSQVIAPMGFMAGIQQQLGVDYWGQYDIAVLKLKVPVPPTITEIMTFGFFGCEQVQDQDIYIAGYPFDRDDGQQMYISDCKVNYDTCGETTLLYHECDTINGVSGSSIWAREGDSIVIKGVHSRYSRAEQSNVGIMLNEYAVQFLNQSLEFFG